MTRVSDEMKNKDQIWLERQALGEELDAIGCLTVALAAKTAQVVQLQDKVEIMKQDELQAEVSVETLQHVLKQRTEEVTKLKSDLEQKKSQVANFEEMSTRSALHIADMDNEMTNILNTIPKEIKEKYDGAYGMVSHLAEIYRDVHEKEIKKINKRIRDGVLGRNKK